MSGDLVFYGFAALTVLSGFVVVLARNVVHAGFALMFALIGVAGLFALLGADFMAVTQTVVYIGGILILVLFAVMMTRIPRLDRTSRKMSRMVPATVFTLGIFALLTKVITGTAWPTSTPGEAVPTVKLIGVELMTNYIFPFEFASLVLLVAMIGAAILIRERRVEEPVADEPTEEVSA
jgi:NADH-quinone oxidoreductase subunit J